MKIKIEHITFTCDYSAVSNNGNTRYFKLRDQMYAEGVIKVLVPTDKGKEVIDMYKVVVDEDFWLIPAYIAVSGDNDIPLSERSMHQWYRSKYWSDYTGDVRGLVLALEGIDIHPNVEHNGAYLWEQIQKVSPTKRSVKFNASDSVRIEETEHEGEKVYYIKK